MRLLTAALAALVTCAPAQATSLKIVTQSLPETRGNPHSYRGLPTALVNQAIFEPLLNVGPGGEIKPGLITSWTQEDRLRWSFKLREGIRFSNQEPFDTAAVIAAFEYLLGTPTAADMLAATTVRAKVARVTARDAHTLVVETKVPDPLLPLHIAEVRTPAPGAWAKGIESFGNNPIGTGPYKVRQWETARVRLVPNPLAAQPGTFSDLEIRMLPDQYARAQALTSGSADIAMDIAAESADAFPDPSYRLAARTATMITFIQFVTVGDSPLKDVNVRRALNYAIDKEKLISVFLRGAVPPATQFTHSGAFGYNFNLKPYPYDPDKAKALLDAAKFDYKRKIPIVFVNGSGPDAAIYQQIGSDLGRIGVQVEFRPMTLATWIGHLQAGDWPGAAFVTGVQGNDPVQAFTTRSCDWPHPHHCDLELMPKLAAARASEDPVQLKGLIGELMAHENANPPGLLLWQRVAFDGLSPRIENYATGQDRVMFDQLTVKE